jgi:alcohol dehydrogenase class IV
MISFAKPDVGSCVMPRQLLFGDEASKKLGELFESWQITKGNVLIVADSEVVKLGLNKDAESSLSQTGYGVCCFEDIVGEPKLETALALVKMVREQQCVGVVGLGGGSAMDMAKLAAAMAVNTGEVSDHFGISQFPIAPLPLILIPTTAGTGSEASAISMLWVEGQKKIVLSPQLVATVAVLDPLMTVSLPPRMTAATGIDALSHALEGFMSLKANPYVDTQAITTMCLVNKWLQKAVDEGQNLEARRAMSYAAFTGGLCLNAGVVLGHSVAYTIAGRANMPHGVSCAIALPYTMVFNLQESRERLRAAAAQVFETTTASPEDLVLWVYNLNRNLGLPVGLEEIGLSEQDVEPMIDECITKYPRPTNPVQINHYNLKVLYSYLLKGDVEGYLGSCKNA